MDYWPRLKLTLHDDVDAFLQAIGDDRVWLLTSKGNRSLWDVDYEDGDWLIFGNESSGLPAKVVARHQAKAVRIPQTAAERCLNLSTAAGIALYTALRGVVR